jgi:hypothetical protein
METKKIKEVKASQAKQPEKEIVKKRISKAMKAARKYKGSVEILDMDLFSEPVLSMEGKARVLIPSEKVFEEGWELLNKLYGVDLRKL